MLHISLSNRFKICDFSFFFNIQYGGNPVSCAVANAVMDVIEQEKLQENALSVGEYLLSEGTKLAYDFDMIGDVRGCGLFVGFDIVLSKSCRTPATQEATWIVDRMKSVHRILISSDGPHENVLKLKPPMVFTRENADEFLAAFVECMKFLQKVFFQSSNETNISNIYEHCFPFQMNLSSIQEEVASEIVTRTPQGIAIKAM